MVTVQHFARLVAEAGGGCIAHVLDEDKLRASSSYWEEYLDPLISAMPDARIHLYAYDPAASGSDETSEAWMQLVIGEVQRFYLGHIPPAHLKVTLVANPTTLAPPYQDQDEVCKRGPVLEMIRYTAQIVSRYAARRLHGDPRNHVVIAVIDSSAVGDNRVVNAENEGY
jgi:hypothetical protein